MIARLNAFIHRTPQIKRDLVSLAWVAATYIRTRRKAHA